jgi:hypothetical protein
MKTNWRFTVAKTVLAFLAVVLGFLVTACVGDVVPSTSGTAVSRSVTPQPSVTSSASPTVLTRAAIRELILEYATFEEVGERYELEINDDTLVGSLDARSPAMPEVYWNFLSGDDEPDVFRLDGVWGPASFVLPEYVGMRLDEIPIVLMIYGEDVGGTAADLLDDDGWEYHILNLSTPGILSANDSVSMGASMDRQ